jgi:hypothetical protein
MTNYDTGWIQVTALELNHPKDDRTPICIRKEDIRRIQPLTRGSINSYIKDMQAHDKSYLEIPKGASVLSTVNPDGSPVVMWVAETMEQIQEMAGIVVPQI